MKHPLFNSQFEKKHLAISVSFNMPRRAWVVWLTLGSILFVAGITLLLFFVLRPKHKPPCTPLFPQRASTAAAGVIISNASGQSWDSVGFGPLPSTLAGPVFDSKGITGSGQGMLDALAADPRVGCVYLQLATAPSLQPWLDAATFLLKNHIAVYALIGMTVQQCDTPGCAGYAGSTGSTYQPLRNLGIQSAQRAVQALQKATGVSQQHIGIAMDIEKLNPAPGTGWSDLPGLLPPRACEGGIPLMLFVGKNDVGKPGMEAAVAAVDTVGLMYYRSMVASNLASDGSNTKFASDMATVTAEGHTMAEAASRSGTNVMAGIETTWETNFRAAAKDIAQQCAAGKRKCTEKTVSFWTKVECADLLEESFVLGGGIPPGTGFTEFLAQSTTQAAYDLTPAKPPSPSMHFFVEELRPMLQLEQNLAHPPSHWPSYSSTSPSGNKDAAKAACVTYGFGAAS